MTHDELNGMTVLQLRKLARENSVVLGSGIDKAGIIEKLVKSGFVERKGKSLIPTKDGNNLVCVLPEQLTSPSMTAEWENTLMQIERGNADADTGERTRTCHASEQVYLICRKPRKA